MVAPAGAGRYAPSPSGDLHIGNLRTAVLAWLFAAASGRTFVVRIEDLDRVRPGAAESQLADLAAIGIASDGPVLKQSTRLTAYRDALDNLERDGLVFECYCSRKDIQTAPQAPHSPPGAYPGTCRRLDAAERRAKRSELAAAGRSPALRLLAGPDPVTVHDQICGPISAPIDDFVLRRGDGVYAYNLAVVVDDAFQDVTQVVRADDLLSSAPRQAYLAGLLGLRAPEYAHVPLVVNSSGARLAKRDGAVTLKELRALGWGIPDVLGAIADSLGLPERRRESVNDFQGDFAPDALPHDPWVFGPPLAL